MKVTSPLRCLIELSSLTASLRPRQNSSPFVANLYRHASSHTSTRPSIHTNSVNLNPLGRIRSFMMSEERRGGFDCVVDGYDRESDHPSSYQTALSSMHSSTNSSGVTTPRTNSQELTNNDVSDTGMSSNFNMEDKFKTGKLVVRILPKDCEDYQNVNLVKLQQYKVDTSTSSCILEYFNKANAGEKYENALDDSDRKSSFNFDKIIETPMVTAEKEGDSNLVLCMDLDVHFDIFYTHHQDRKSIHIHMNRNADELANRTMKRLELSIAKKVSGIVGKPGGGTRKKTKKEKKNAAASAAAKQSSVDIFVRDNGINNGLGDLDIETCTALQLFQLMASKHDEDYMPHRTGLTLPLTIPTHDNIIARPYDTKSNVDKEGNVDVELGVITNPPTILSIQTFELFNSELFATVPITIQTELIYASKAIVSWFVENDGDSDHQHHECVLHDSHSFIPQACHIGKRLIVMVTPYRADYNGPSFPESYRFVNVIKPLPYMPIVSPLRDNFTRSRYGIQKQSKLVKGMSTTTCDENSIRVMTYNILADLYVSRDENIGATNLQSGSNEDGSDSVTGSDMNQDTQHSTLYPHVKFEHLKKTRRMPMIIAEILAYDADVICLQEVDGSVYDTYLYPVMRASGYDGFYSNKASCQREGCVMFWKERKYEGIDCLSFSVRDLFDLDPEPEDTEDRIKQTSQICAWHSMEDIQELLRNHEELRKVTMEKIGQVLQVAKLRLKSTAICNGKEDLKTFIVANTHLFYHPKADHIRAMQAYVVCRKIDEISRGCDGDNINPSPLMLCGDLNSDPLSGACQLLMSRSVGPQHYECWKYLDEYRWEMGNTDYMTEHQYIGNKAGATDLAYEDEMFANAEENVSREDSFAVTSPPLIALPDTFPNLVSGCDKMPEFTNYAVDFIDTLDYILASEPGVGSYGFAPKGSARMPTAEEVKQYVAMPNKFMPSDHVSVVCDFEWITQNNKATQIDRKPG